MSAGFRKLGETEVFRGDRITVARASFVAPDGTTFERDIVHHPGAVGVVPLVEEGGAVLLVRQYRPSLQREMLEIPAGVRDQPGEPPEETARRELVEEVGMRAGRMERLLSFHNSPGFSDEEMHLFVAFDLERSAPDRHGIEESFMSVERVLVDDVAAMARDGRITDAKTIIGVALARENL